MSVSACSVESELAEQTSTSVSQQHLFAQAQTVDFSAHWLSQNIIVAPKQYANINAQLLRFTLPDDHVAERIALVAAEMPSALQKTFPHLASFQAYQVNLPPEDIKVWLKSKLAVAFTLAENKQHLAYLQTGNVIDDLYTSNDNDADEVTDLGATLLPTGVNFKLWAPTAQQVSVLLFNEQLQPLPIEKVALTEDSKTGIWQATIVHNSSAIYYRYLLDVYHPRTGKIESIQVTDPYSLSLSVNSEYSHVIDLNAANTMPNGWLTQPVASVGAPENNIFYETHIGDFSAHDASLSAPQYRGKYLAFTEKNSDGIKHLKALKEAGVNNIHLMPTFDLGTINEDKDTVIDMNTRVSKVCQLHNIDNLCAGSDDKNISLAAYLAKLPASDESRQAIVSALREVDNYNWGYDPYHYTVPEGSYALNAQGEKRIVEFRQMVQSIHQLGFRVIMDVVYNHTHQAGLAPTSVLDKIVPNYYHRLDPISGEISQSTCCDNTATERAMMSKLMIDSLVVWARDYKIDGFRFDLMAHQPKAAMLQARKAVQAVDPDTYFYGEGWNFGEVANHQRFEQASQLALAGTEIGTFTDRLRDAVRGGAFNAVGEQIRQSQGIGNGLGTMPNELQEGDLSDYYLKMDQIRVGLAANLANFPLENANGDKVLGKDIPYGDQPTGYALDPADTINYISKHDNQTLWDNNQYRIAYQLPTSDRVRMHMQSLAFPIFAQGIPFIHMGSELLRSKSFLRDSYDYGDWFNKVDFSKQDNNYNVGLPPKVKDGDNWTMINTLLTKNQGRDHVKPSDIAFSAEVFLEMLKVRASLPQLRLTTAEQIIEQVSFHNTGKQQQLGLIVMSIKGGDEKNVVVIFNTDSKAQQFSAENFALDFTIENFELHPILQQSIDDRVATSKVDKNGFYVPALTTAVFVEK